VIRYENRNKVPAFDLAGFINDEGLHGDIIGEQVDFVEREHAERAQDDTCAGEHIGGFLSGRRKILARQNVALHLFVQVFVPVEEEVVRHQQLEIEKVDVDEPDCEVQ